MTQVNPLARLPHAPARFTLLFCLFCARAALDAPPAAAAPSDPLWLKAVAIVAQNDLWTAGMVDLEGSELDGRGRTRSSWIVQTRVSPGPDGMPIQDIVRYVENGKDVTAGRRQAQGGRQPARGGSGRRGAFSWNPSEPRETPFHPATQERVTIRRLESGVLRDGRSCVAYEFEQALGERDMAVGTAWLDAESGAPVGLSATFKPLPPFVHDAEIVVDYAMGPDGAWLVRRFHVRGDATILLVKRSFTMDITMADHWRQTVRPEE